MPAKAEVKYGFWVAIGVMVALAAFGFLQVLILRAVRRDG